MKRIFALFLIFALLLSGCGGAAPVEDTLPAATEPVISPEERIEALNLSASAKEELLQAAQLGFSMEKIQQDSISGKEMAALLDHFVTLAAPENLAAWQEKYQVLRTSEESINRLTALGAVYLAAREAGGDWPVYQAYPYPFFQTVPSPWESDLGMDQRFSWDLFYGHRWEEPFLCGKFGRFEGLDAASYYYNMARISSVSGEYLFSYDPEANSFHWENNPTYAEAVLAVIRLLASDRRYENPYAPGEDSQPYLAQADVRRAAIRAAENDCTEGVTGTIYYISNQGSDDNNGRSPETPWATPEPLYSAGLKSGDAILFERGGQWFLKKKDQFPFNRIGAAALDLGTINGNTKHITLGAYGTGSKPILRGDLPEANDPGYWTLYSEENGAKIWKTAEALTGTNVIVFNEGEAFAEQIFPWWDGETNWITPEGTPFTPETALNRDLTFTWLPEITPEYQELLRTSNEVAFQTHGPVYLRCDAGNPAEIYDVVSLPQTGMGVALNEGCTASDLDIRYFPMVGVNFVGDGPTTKGQTCRNLEISWCGGFLHRYAEVWDEQGFRGWQAGYTGGGSMITVNADVTIENCYYHHCGTRALVLSINGYDGMSKEYKMTDYSIGGNLFEYCGSALHIADCIRMTYPGSGGFLSNLVFEDNIVMHSGYGWSYNTELQDKGCTSYMLSAVENASAACHNDGIYFRNNLFYRSRFALVSLTDHILFSDELVNAQPIFEGNTYVQPAGFPILQRNDVRVFGSAQEILEELGDAAGTVVWLE